MSFGQDSNTVYYKLFIEANTTNLAMYGGSFKEGQGFTIREKEIKELQYADDDLRVFQELYDALVGGYFSIDFGALDKDIIMKMYLRNLDTETGTYKPLGEDENTLFAYFEIRIIEIPDSTYSPDDTVFPDSSYFMESNSYYFTEGKYARLVLPKTERFLNFLDKAGIARNDSLSFAFLQNEDWDTTDTNFEKTKDWNGEGIEIIDTEDSVTFKAIHLSKVGGGRGRIHKERSVVGIKYYPTIPKDFQLEQNYPNPFNPETRIKYSIPNSAKRKNTFVKLDVYNVLGTKVKTLVNENQRSGTYEVSFDATDLASGVYIYSLQNNNAVLTRRMILIK